MNLQAILSAICPCRRRGTEPKPEPVEAPGTITEDRVWNCAPTEEPIVTAAAAEPETAPPTLLEQINAQLAALPPRPPKTFQNVVEHMVEVRDRLIKENIDYAENATQLWISYQGTINTLQWIFSPGSDKTWDETIDGPAYDAIIEPLDEDYYKKHVFPAWRWKARKI